LAEAGLKRARFGHKSIVATFSRTVLSIRGASPIGKRVPRTFGNDGALGEALPEGRCMERGDETRGSNRDVEDRGCHRNAACNSTPFFSLAFSLCRLGRGALDLLAWDRPQARLANPFRLGSNRRVGGRLVLRPCLRCVFGGHLTSQPPDGTARANGSRGRSGSSSRFWPQTRVVAADGDPSTRLIVATRCLAW
jgi:hypothetical protein